MDWLMVSISDFFYTDMCFINGTCYLNGQTKMSSNCYSCITNISKTSWTLNNGLYFFISVFFFAYNRISEMYGYSPCVTTFHKV